MEPWNMEQADHHSVTPREAARHSVETGLWRCNRKSGRKESMKETHERHLDVGAVLGSKRCGYDIQGPGVTP